MNNILQTEFPVDSWMKWMPRETYYYEDMLDMDDLCVSSPSPIQFKAIELSPDEVLIPREKHWFYPITSYEAKKSKFKKAQKEAFDLQSCFAGIHPNKFKD